MTAADTVYEDWSYGDKIDELERYLVMIFGNDPPLVGAAMSMAMDIEDAVGEA